MKSSHLPELVPGRGASPSAQASALATHEMELGPGGDVRQDRQGWITFEAPAAEPVAVHEALAVHHAWLGPTKLVHGAEGLRQRAEIALPQFESAGPCYVLDEAEAEQAAVLRRAVLRAVGQMRVCPAGSGLRNLIEPAAIRTWVQAEGHTVATDEQGNLRLAIAYEGFDGQMRIECGPSRLRLAMALGGWAKLPPAVACAMLHLAAEANACTRLVRIAWLDDPPKSRCEAEVDLTGVPCVGADHPSFDPTARRMLQLALAGLALSARRLGHELAALAAPANRGLAEEISERAAAAPWWEGRSGSAVGQRFQHQQA
jgi:hypothetical protein